MNEPKFITQPLTMSDGSTGTITVMHSPLFDGVKGITTPHTPGSITTLQGDGFKLRFANPVSNYNPFNGNIVWMDEIDLSEPEVDPQAAKKFEDFDKQVTDGFGDMLKY